MTKHAGYWAVKLLARMTQASGQWLLLNWNKTIVFELEEEGVISQGKKHNMCKYFSQYCLDLHCLTLVISIWITLFIPTDGTPRQIIYIWNTFQIMGLVLWSWMLRNENLLQVCPLSKRKDNSWKVSSHILSERWQPSRSNVIYSFSFESGLLSHIFKAR